MWFKCCTVSNRVLEDGATFLHVLPWTPPLAHLGYVDHAIWLNQLGLYDLGGGT